LRTPNKPCWKAANNPHVFSAGKVRQEHQRYFSLIRKDR
jgi:hypothetical protein